MKKLDKYDEWDRNERHQLKSMKVIVSEKINRNKHPKAFIEQAFDDYEDEEYLYEVGNPY